MPEYPLIPEPMHRVWVKYYFVMACRIQEGMLRHMNEKCNGTFRIHTLTYNSVTVSINRRISEAQLVSFFEAEEHHILLPGYVTSLHMYSCALLPDQTFMFDARGRLTTGCKSLPRCAFHYTPSDVVADLAECGHIRVLTTSKSGLRMMQRNGRSLSDPDVVATIAKALGVRPPPVLLLQQIEADDDDALTGLMDLDDDAVAGLADLDLDFLVMDDDMISAYYTTQQRLIMTLWDVDETVAEHLWHVLPKEFFNMVESRLVEFDKGKDGDLAYWTYVLLPLAKVWCYFLTVGPYRFFHQVYTKRLSHLFGRFEKENRRREVNTLQHALRVALGKDVLPSTREFPYDAIVKVMNQCGGVTTDNMMHAWQSRYNELQQCARYVSTEVLVCKCLRISVQRFRHKPYKVGGYT